VIRGKKMWLRAINASDVEALYRWSNDPDTWALLGGWHFPLSRESVASWVSSLKADSLHQRFIIETPDIGVIGTANLVDINWKDSNAFHGTMIGEAKARGQGFGYDVVMTVMRYAFDELGLHRLDTTIIEHNQVSMKLYRDRCGWKEEGRQSGWYFRNGRRWDRVHFGVTSEQYRALEQTAKYWTVGDAAPK